MKKTKIIATVGPSCEQEGHLRNLITLGVNVFRLNFKHNEPDWHRMIARRIKALAVEMEVVVGVLIDLQGPEIRIKLASDSIELEAGTPVALGPAGIDVTHPQIIPHLSDGERIVLNDGQYECAVRKNDDGIWLVPTQSGELGNHKSINIPDADIPLEVLASRDYIGIDIAAQEKIDFVALSFARTVSDIETLSQALKKVGSNAKIVAKIEAKKAIANIDGIIDAADIIMVARGDLGVELPPEQVPHYQKKIIRKCIARGVPVITATQMLESMIEHPHPTRAEISDVANAVFDLTDALMLSGESAVGAYPAEAVASMARTAEYNESFQQDDVRSTYRFHLGTQAEHLGDAAYNMYHSNHHNSPFAAFVVISQTGRSAQLISRYRAHIPVFAFVPTSDVARSLTINYGITPLVKKAPVSGDHEIVEKTHIISCIMELVEQKLLQKNVSVIVMHGDMWGVVGGSSVVRIMRS